MRWFEDIIDQAQKWKKKGESGFFFGQRIGDMDKDELLAIIGFLSEESARQEKAHKQELDFLETINKARP